jgi:hypothetical protein
MDQRLPESVSRVLFSLSSAQRGSDPLGFLPTVSPEVLAMLLQAAQRRAAGLLWPC